MIMGKDTVEVYSVDAQSVLIPSLGVGVVPVPDAYYTRIGAVKGFKRWVVDRCLWVLSSCGVLEPYSQATKEVEYTQFEIDILNLDRFLLQYLDEIHYTTGWKIDTVLVGRKGMHELMGKVPQSPFRFQHPDVKTIGNGCGNCINFSGINVVMLPWFDGMVAVPNLKE
jgi:hypothetical protein